jgi:hypothetical protein
MASANTNVRILAGIVGLCGCAVLIQYLGNERLDGKIRELQQQEEHIASALAASRRAAPRQAAEAAALERIKAIGQAMKNPAYDFSASPGFQTNRLRTRGQVLVDYAALFRRLRLSPAEQASLGQLLLDRRMTQLQVANTPFPGADRNDLAMLKAAVTAATADLDAQIRQELGPERFGEYQGYEATLGYRAQVNIFAGQLHSTDAPLRDDQADRLVTLLAKARTDVQPLPDSLATDLGAILDPKQAPALHTFLEGLRARQTILSMNRAALTSSPPLIQRPTANALLYNLQP